MTDHRNEAEEAGGERCKQDAASHNGDPHEEEKECPDHPTLNELAETGQEKTGESGDNIACRALSHTNIKCDRPQPGRNSKCTGDAGRRMWCRHGEGKGARTRATLGKGSLRRRNTAFAICLCRLPDLNGKKEVSVRLLRPADEQRAAWRQGGVGIDQEGFLAPDLEI